MLPVTYRRPVFFVTESAFQSDVPVESLFMVNGVLYRKMSSGGLAWDATISDLIAHATACVVYVDPDKEPIVSEITGITGAAKVLNIVAITQANYDAIGSGNYDAQTFYAIIP